MSASGGQAKCASFLFPSRSLLSVFSYIEILIPLFKGKMHFFLLLFPKVDASWVGQGMHTWKWGHQQGQLLY